MTTIKPIDLPTAAGVEFGLGDVRHFSESDAVAVPGLQGPTRHLAQRDNLLASKVNEVVAVVNNKEQFVPLPLLRTAIPPGVEEIISNFRIPVGYEARVINASIASVPSTSDLTLKIFYNTSFGGQTGTELVSTADEFTAGTAFYNTGELIVTIRNNGVATLESATSVTLTIRPMGSTGSLLIGSTVRGDRGYKGDKGEPGAPGVPGPGAPSVAIVWRGDYSGATTYNPGDAVYYATTGSSYICKLATTPGNAPTVTTYWNLMASGGSGGTGITPKGVWVSGTAYIVGDVVSYATGGVTSSYICHTDGTTTLPSTPATDTAVWDLLCSGGSSAGGETPTYQNNDLTSTASYTKGSGADTVTSGDYQGLTTTGSVPLSEAAIINTVGTPKAVALLYGRFQVVMPKSGAVTITLPTSVAASALWTNGEAAITVSVHGTFTAVTSPTVTNFITVADNSTTGWVVTNPNATDDLKLEVVFTGIKTF
jgi:hypothetical protein